MKRTKKGVALYQLTSALLAERMRRRQWKHFMFGSWVLPEIRKMVPFFPYQNNPFPHTERTISMPSYKDKLSAADRQRAESDARIERTTVRVVDRLKGLSYDEAETVLGHAAYRLKKKAIVK